MVDWTIRPIKIVDFEAEERIIHFSSFVSFSSKTAIHGLAKDPSLPQNALYSNFVRAGSGLGLYHKRKFDNPEDGEEEDEKRSEERRVGKECSS